MSQGVEFNRLMLDMRAMQADAMSLPKVSAAPELAPGQSSFADMLGQAIGKVHETQRRPDRRDDCFAKGQRFHAGDDPGAQQAGPGVPGHHADAGLRTDVTHG